MWSHLTVAAQAGSPAATSDQALPRDSYVGRRRNRLRVSMKTHLVSVLANHFRQYCAIRDETLSGVSRPDHMTTVNVTFEAPPQSAKRVAELSSHLSLASFLHRFV